MVNFARLNFAFKIINCFAPVKVEWQFVHNVCMNTLMMSHMSSSHVLWHFSIFAEVFLFAVFQVLALVSCAIRLKCAPHSVPRTISTFA